MGLTISFGDNLEAIPSISNDISDLEYQLTTKIKKVTATETSVVAFLTSQGAISPSTNMQSAYQSLSELYTVRDIELTEEESTIAEDINTLVISGATENFDDLQLEAINSFLARGGALIVLEEGITINDGLQVSPRATGLEGLLAKYGITINNDLVADQQSGRASFSQGIFSFSTPYPFWPLITSDGLSSDYPAVSGLENVVLPWASSITLDDSILSGAQVDRLIESSKKSWLQKDNFQIIPQQIPAATVTNENYTMGVSVKGQVSNPYAADQDEKMNINVIVVSDSDFALDSFVGSSPDNLNLLLNLVDSVSLDDALIEIRSKAVTSRPINEDELDDAKRLSIRYFNVFGITVLVLIFGVMRYYGRRKSRFVDDL